ncbi:hypothetical protein EES43_24775 [Streptomyces sp. ADI96-02]|uniref:hypothetical protein n=1 Tax=Streptomyces sp. ADI96-02 TaxID=1522760 RepID=UPI000F559686|nr:hypothetical protein [Streptomyces sp. ADI96-02]RPK56261.1 hypothetical protein EES43_24775 [Streptomyces sp. ADI96-02]
MNEAYDPLPDLIDRAEKRHDGISQLKEVARLALHWHRPELGWATDNVTKDPETGKLLWKATTGCACGSGEFPCRWRRQITAVFGVSEEYRL